MEKDKLMTGTLNFSVSGEFITDFARQRFIETKSRKTGVDILRKCLIGFPEDLAMDVVSGRAKLIGINELKVIPDCAFVEPYSWIKPCNIEDCECGWIAPDGRVFGYSEYNQNRMPHECLAERIVQRDDCGIVMEGDTLQRPYYHVEKAGWIKFCPTMAIADCKASAITESQQKELVKFMKSHDYVLTLGFNSTANYMQVRSMSTIMLGRLLNILPH